MRAISRIVAITAATTATAATALVPSAAAAPRWAPADDASIRPGARTTTDGASCTANFVFHGAGKVYIGQAAHCASREGSTQVDGCETTTHPVGTKVEIAGASRAGRLAYSSWDAMRHRGEDDPDACAFNHFALVEIHPDDVDDVNPSIPFWGGPTGLNASGTRATHRVFSYGDSPLRQGIDLLKPKDGGSVGTSGGGWNHRVYTLTPGVPGDSGSAFLDRSGRALGVLSTLTILPLPASNGVSDLRRALDYMREAGGPDVELAEGTERFRPRTILGVL